jgi:hypothetical protein
MAQAVKCLPSKREVLSSSPSAIKKKEWVLLPASAFHFFSFLLYKEELFIYLA